METISFTIRADSGLIWGVGLALVVFGAVYNRAVALAERRGWTDGFVSLLVVLGTLITLGGVAVVSWQAALLTLGAFVCSGAPMVAGSIWRYVRLRESERVRVRREVLGDDTEETGKRGDGRARPGGGTDGGC